MTATAEAEAVHRATIPVMEAGRLETDGIAALEEAGCLRVTGVAGPGERERLRAELAPYMQRARVETGSDPREFLPGHTRRIIGLVRRSEVVRDWVMHPMPRRLCDHFLQPNCDARYQLHLTSALEVGPGAREQLLHREEDTLPYFPLPRPNLVLATMWAVSDFRADNGATLLVPGSHRWPKERRPREEEIAAAEMEAGSVLVWLGGTLHGAGANVSEDWRYGVILTYSVGWVRQEENQALAVPDQVARELPKDLLDMIGHTTNGLLGFSDTFFAEGAPQYDGIMEMNRQRPMAGKA